MTTNEMWGGRFAQGPAAIMEEINASIDFDRRLYAQDIAASKVHAAMLAKRIPNWGFHRDELRDGAAPARRELESWRRAAPRLKVLAHSEIPDTHTIRIGSTQTAEQVSTSNPLSLWPGNNFIESYRLALFGGKTTGGSTIAPVCAVVGTPSSTSLMQSGRKRSRVTRRSKWARSKRPRNSRNSARSNRNSRA